VDEGLQKVIGHRNSPLVFAGVDYLFPIYQEANSYPHLIPESVEDAIDHIDIEKLHEKAWKIVEPHFVQVYENEVKRFQDQINTERTSQDMRRIVAASNYQRVDTLFLNKDERIRGEIIDLGNEEIQFVDQEQVDKEEMLNFAALHTLKNKGRVFAVEGEKMPFEAPAAAIFRY